MTITYHKDIEQGSPEWFSVRCGLISASEASLILSKKTDKKTGAVTYETPDNSKVKAHTYELLAQRIFNYVEPSYIGENMIRGTMDEIDARNLYSQVYAPVEEVGFVTNNKWGFALGCSPDGLVGRDGMIEVKSRLQKFQVETIIDDEMPDDYTIQVQTALLVTERKWCDFISFCSGAPMMVKRIKPDPMIQAAIVVAAKKFEDDLAVLLDKYNKRMVQKSMRLTPTERRLPIEDNITVEGEVE